MPVNIYPQTTDTGMIPFGGNISISKELATSDEIVDGTQRFLRINKYVTYNSVNHSRLLNTNYTKIMMPNDPGMGSQITISCNNAYCDPNKNYAHAYTFPVLAGLCSYLWKSSGAGQVDYRLVAAFDLSLFVNSTTGAVVSGIAYDAVYDWYVVGVLIGIGTTSYIRWYYSKDGYHWSRVGVAELTVGATSTATISTTCASDGKAANAVTEASGNTTVFVCNILQNNTAEIYDEGAVGINNLVATRDGFIVNWAGNAIAHVTGYGVRNLITSSYQGFGYAFDGTNHVWFVGAPGYLYTTDLKVTPTFTAGGLAGGVTGGTVMWTGSYFQYTGAGGVTPGTQKSTTGVTWTAGYGPYAGMSNDLGITRNSLVDLTNSVVYDGTSNIVYMGGTYYAVVIVNTTTTARCIKSTNLREWTLGGSITLSNANIYINPVLKVLNNTLFLFGRGNNTSSTFMTSTDGTTWTTRTITTVTTIWDIAYFDTKYFVGGAAVTSLNYNYSTDLTTWTTGLATVGTTTTVQCFATNGTVLVAGGSAGDLRYTGTGVPSWANAGSTFQPFDAVYTGTHFVFKDNIGGYRYSTVGSSSWSTGTYTAALNTTSSNPTIASIGDSSFAITGNGHMALYDNVNTSPVASNFDLGQLSVSTAGATYPVISAANNEYLVSYRVSLNFLRVSGFGATTPAFVYAQGHISNSTDNTCCYVRIK